MKPFVLYECRAVDGAKHLCSLGLKFTEKRSLQSHFGRIEAAIFYHDPESNNRLKRLTNAQSWYKNPEGDYCMGITRFSLPPSLQGIGLGPVIWSEIFKGLPDTIKDRLNIFGSLNSGDAFTPQTDSDGKLIFEIKNGQRNIKMLNQIKRRNRFWAGMIKPVDNGASPLKCDESGNGAFNGYFKDPLLNCISNKIVLSKTNSAQSRDRSKPFSDNAA